MSNVAGWENVYNSMIWTISHHIFLRSYLTLPDHMIKSLKLSQFRPTIHTDKRWYDTSFWYFHKLHSWGALCTHRQIYQIKNEMSGSNHFLKHYWGVFFFQSKYWVMREYLQMVYEYRNHMIYSLGALVDQLRARRKVETKFMIYTEWIAWMLYSV